FFSSRRRHTSFSRDWSSDVCSSDLPATRRTARGESRRLRRGGARLPGHRARGGTSRRRGGGVAAPCGLPIRRRSTWHAGGGGKRSEERRVGKRCRAGGRTAADTRRT